MDNASLPYLKEIADALRKISGSWSATGGGSSSASVAGNIDLSGLNFDGIADAIEAGLVVTMTEDEETVTRPALNILGNDIIATLHDAFFINVIEGEGSSAEEVEKSVFEVIKDDISEI